MQMAQVSDSILLKTIITKNMNGEIKVKTMEAGR
jgi:hypothetical protein